jgi:hypothetical protein
MSRDFLPPGGGVNVIHRFLTPLGYRDWFAKVLPGARVIELEWFEVTTHQGLIFRLLPAQHWTKRSPWDINRSLWGALIIQSLEHKVFFGGDSGYFFGFEEYGRKFGPLDVALLPIGAYEPRWFMAALLLASAGPSHARGGAHGFRGHHGFGRHHGFGGSHIFVGIGPFWGPYWEWAPNWAPYAYPPMRIRRCLSNPHRRSIPRLHHNTGTIATTRRGTTPISSSVLAAGDQLPRSRNRRHSNAIRGDEAQTASGAPTTKAMARDAILTRLEAGLYRGVDGW